MTAKKTSKSASALASNLLATMVIGMLLLMCQTSAAATETLAPLSSPEGETIALPALNDTIEAPSGAVGGATPTTTSRDTLTISLPTQKKEKPRFLQGAAVGADFFGLALKAFGSDWRQMEAFFRLNLYDSYFPIFELGIGEADHEGLEIENRFRIRAPYFRVGVDHNFANKKHSGNRIFGGLRYGFSTYNYDYDAPGPVIDPVWKTSQICSEHDLSGHLHWMEMVIGVETKLWSFVRLGWDLRAKMRISQKAPETGEPWYFPGFGKNTAGLVWGGSFKLVFDI
ncbi:MAG: hypothetical protein J5545_05110 [Bacteroidaceae bacterium]|nr:hypothetical protein [Bacteroidaceae bacterium]